MNIQDVKVETRATVLVGCLGPGGELQIGSGEVVEVLPIYGYALPGTDLAKVATYAQSDGKIVALVRTADGARYTVLVEHLDQAGD